MQTVCYGNVLLLRNPKKAFVLRNLLEKELEPSVTKEDIQLMTLPLPSSEFSF